MLETIYEILGRGNTVEIKNSKNGIIILEVKRKIKETDEITVANKHG
jgi:hypothetical protein